MKKRGKIILTVVFAIWFGILLIATNGGSSANPVASTETVQEVKADSNPEPSQNPVEPTQQSSETPRAISEQDAKDACLSFFTEIVMNTYNEIPWGEGTENGVKINSDYSQESQSGTVTISYALMDEPNAGTQIVMDFALEADQVSISKISIDGVEQELPADAKDSVLIWLLLDKNHEG
jgi:cytoskeletal protein RodZ